MNIGKIVSFVVESKCFCEKCGAKTVAAVKLQDHDFCDYTDFIGVCRDCEEDFVFLRSVDKIPSGHSVEVKKYFINLSADDIQKTKEWMVSLHFVPDYLRHKILTADSFSKKEIVSLAKTEEILNEFELKNMRLSGLVIEGIKKILKKAKKNTGQKKKNLYDRKQLSRVYY
jgi:hypothetical protein